MKLFIHSQTSTVQLLKVGNGISNFIPHFNWHVMTYPCKRGPSADSDPGHHQTPSVYHCLQNHSGYDSDKFSCNLKVVWLNPSWCYWVLTTLHNQDYQNPNIKSHLLKFLMWKPVSVSYKVVQWMYTGNSSALCLGFPSHHTWVDSGSSNEI